MATAVASTSRETIVAVGPSAAMSNEANLRIREQHIAESCELHFNNNPMKIVRSKDQYLFDDMGNRYLDFVSRITNVGHCNSKVVEAACRQMTKISMAFGSGEGAQLQQTLTEQLLSTLPPNFEVVLYTNSGAEANDLALQMARNYTNRRDLVVVDGAFHGTGNLLVDISPRAFRASSEGKKPWVHVIPVPDTFRGPHTDDDLDAGEKYFQDAKKVLDRAMANNHQIAGLICEPLLVVHGVLVPPSNWLSKLYSYIHEIGGVVVADEIQCGMGRTAEHFWAFEGQNAVPDILTVGKPMGNGHPIGAVITSKQIAATISNADLIYSCDPVGAVISSTVLYVMEDKNLRQNAQRLGSFLATRLKLLMLHHAVIGDVRQKGLIIGVDIVRAKGSKKPAPEIAEEISNHLRNEGILVGCEGDYKNILLFLPALCISEQDCNDLVDKLDQVVKVVELSFLDDLYDILNSPSPPQPSSSGLQASAEPSPPSEGSPMTTHPYDALD